MSVLQDWLDADMPETWYPVPDYSELLEGE